jgi:alpha-glucosidase (family GH31 glycosyl hydrolase)
MKSVARARVALIALGLFSARGAPGAEESDRLLRFGGAPVELTISEVGERTLRLEVAPLDDDGRPRPRPPSTVLAQFPSTEKLRAREIGEDRELLSGSLRVTVKTRPLSVSVRRGDGQLVQELSFDPGGEAAVGFLTGAPVLGLGEGAQQFDRRGARYPMQASWGGWNRPVLGSVVPSPFLIGTDGWALFVHLPDGEFDLREGRGRFLPRAAAGGRPPLDLFVVSVEDPVQAPAEYYRLTGRPVMPPRWALGYFQSHRTLSGPEEPVAIARTFREKRLPCDGLIYLGTGYCPAGWNTGHGSLEFNPRTFDRPAERIGDLHRLDFKVILHVNRAPAGLFGSSPAEESSAPEHIRNYWARHRGAFGLGVDGWWPDDGDELPVEARLARHRAYYLGSLEDRPGRRPFSLHRTGTPGAQRYGGWIWSGDIDSRWATLASQVAVGLNHSLSLTPFWGTDTGGFYPTRELTGELYARWFQFSAFCPLFRSHGRTWKLRLPWGWDTGQAGPVEHPDGPDESELKNAAVEPICRKFLELRYRLLPYNYTLAREACDGGPPPMRALWLHDPRDPEAVKLGDEYLWGRDILVAPVVEKGATVRRVYLPAGVWYDHWSGEKIAGPRWIERPVDLATMPLFVRGGAIIPLDPVRQSTSEPASEPTTLRVYPGADGAFTLYDDDGESQGWRDGTDPRMVWIRVRWADASRRLTLEADPRMKSWPGGARRFRVEAAGAAAGPREVEFRGTTVSVDL